MKRSFVSAQNKCFSFTKSTWEKNIFIFFKLGRKQAAPFSFYKYHKSICKVDPRPLGIRSMEQIHPLLKHWIGGPTINDEDTNSIWAGQTGNQKLATYPKLRVLSCLFLFFFEPFKQIKYKLLRYWHKNYCDRDRLLSFLAVTKAGSKKVFGREHLRLNDHHQLSHLLPRHSHRLLAASFKRIWLFHTKHWYQEGPKQPRLTAEKL